MQYTVDNLSGSPLSVFLSILLIPEFSDDQDCSAGCGAQHVAQIVGETPCLAHDHKNLQ